jgi:hypothetical protein
VCWSASTCRAFERAEKRSRGGEVRVGTRGFGREERGLTAFMFLTGEELKLEGSGGDWENAPEVRAIEFKSTASERR